jgi:hypothetical protein
MKFYHKQFDAAYSTDYCVVVVVGSTANNFNYRSKL